MQEQIQQPDFLEVNTQHASTIWYVQVFGSTALSFSLMLTHYFSRNCTQINDFYIGKLLGSKESELDGKKLD